MLSFTLRVGKVLVVTLLTVNARLTRPGDDEYSIWPMSPISDAAVQAITADVQKYAGGADEVYVFQVSPKASSIERWGDQEDSTGNKTVLVIREDRIEVIVLGEIHLFEKGRRETVLVECFPECQCYLSQLRNFATQTLPATELKVISQPGDSAIIDHFHNDVYRTDTRKETYITTTRPLVSMKNTKTSKVFRSSGFRWACRSAKVA